MRSSIPADQGGVVIAAAVLGTGLSGFFDGILLHQVLQWHHLLSLVPGEAFRDIGTQILADGLFHVLMYIVTAIGLVMLWRSRGRFATGGAGWRSVVGGGLAGFGIWNVIDVAFFHWTLGIHRIRVNVPDPMLYDISWLLSLGLLPLIFAWMLFRRGKGRSQGKGGAAAIGLSILAVVAAPLAALPQPGATSSLVLVAPGESVAPLINAAMEEGAPIVWIDPKGRMMSVRLDEHTNAAARLYRSGALLVTRSPAIAGCAARAAI